MINNRSYSSDYPDRYFNTYTPASKSYSYCPINFTKRGFRQFSRVNQLLGKGFIRAFVLYREVAAYITAHEADGYHLDTICLDVRYIKTHSIAALFRTWDLARQLSHHQRLGI